MSTKQFYNKKKKHTKQERKESPIIRIRTFNNWIVAELIKQYIQPGFSVFEMSIGKGGAISKYAHAGISSLYGMDISDQSLIDAKDRYNKIKPSFPLHLYQGDMTMHFEAEIPPVDVVASQFAIHYGFGSYDSASVTISNCFKYLSPGGTLIITCPDDKVVTEYLKDGKFNSPHLCLTSNSKQCSGFGVGYTFWLEDAIIDVPEYVVYRDKLLELTSDYADLVYDANFMDFYKEYYSNSSVKKIYQIKLDEDDITVVRFYKVYIFRKKGDEPSHKHKNTGYTPLNKINLI